MRCESNESSRSLCSFLLIEAAEAPPFERVAENVIGPRRSERGGEKRPRSIGDLM